MNTPGIAQVGLSALLVLLSIAINRYWKIPVIKDISIGSVRAFVQLIAVGYALQFIFRLDSAWLIVMAILIMITVGAQAASSRTKNLKGSFAVSLVAMLAGSLITIGLMLVFRVISFEARYIIPLGGMIIGNSMNASALTIDRLTADIRGNRLAIESALSLGKGWRLATSKYLRAANTTGMISVLNFMKTVGIVALPGAMTGMILAGADPLHAVFLQIIVAYMLLMAVTITSIVTVHLTVRKFFTRYHQLRHGV